MAEVVIFHQDLHSRAASGWKHKTTKFAPGTSVKYYLARFPGLSGSRTNRQLRVGKLQEGKRVWVKVRTSYVLKEGENIALTPKEW